MLLVIGGILVLIIIVCILLKLIVFMPSVRGENGIAVLETVEIGGVNQAILIRSEDIGNPILLYLHSGPGTTEMSAFRAYHAELEKHFTVVVWEQRGTGKSYSSLLSPDMMTIDQMVADAGEVIEYLQTKFDKQKIFIAGHSWGSLLGILTVQQYPDDIYAYVGSGQEVQPAAGEKISYAYTLNKAEELGNTQAVKELKQLTESFEYLTITDNPNWYEDLLTERKWLVKFGGEVHNRDNINSIYVIPGILPSEYTLVDFIHFGQGSQFSLKTLWPQVMKVNLMESADSLSVPVFLIQGRYDYNTPSSLVSEYYDRLDAPYKELIWLENSGHHAMYEEAQLYDSILVEKLLPLAKTDIVYE
jgi:pimeloyl-ACP methyl ester carboxylesterase